MSKTTALIAALLLAGVAGKGSAQQSQTFRDNSGRITGRSASDSQGSTTF